MNKEMVCVACPIGCSLVVELDKAGTILSVAGNQCKRGNEYAITECTAPTRTLTTTAKVLGGITPLVPVRSAKPLPKGLLIESVKLINALKIKAPIKIGDVLIANVLDSGVDIIASNSCPKM
ncbi:MAG: DUF1667 domain-containing protein [Clostridiales bacterium]|nr:DUF1667 domain-containing protein [Clostridiales bacterium]